MGIAAPTNAIDASRQLKNGLTYLLPVGVGGLIPFLTLPFITRALSPEQYGAWALSIVYASFVTGLANVGLSAGFERGFFQHQGAVERTALLHGVVGFVTGMCVVGGIVTVVWREAISEFLFGQRGYGGLICAAYSARMITSIKGYYLLQLRNSDDARKYAWYSVDETMIGGVLSVAFVAWLGMGPIGLSVGQALAGAVVLLAVIWRAGRSSRTHWGAARPLVTPLLREALIISLPLTPRVFLGVVSSNFDKYIISLLSTLGGVGIYSLGQRVAYLAFQIITAIEHVFVPEVYRRMFAEGPGAGRSIGRYLTPFAYVSAAVALGIVVVSEEALWWLAPEAYAGGAAVACLLSVSYGLLFFGKLPQLTYARRTAWASVLTMVSLLANVGVNLLTVPRWGAIGAAAGTVAAGLVAGSLGFWIRQRLYPIGWEWRVLAVIFGGLLASGVLVAGLPILVPTYGWRLVVKVAVVLLYVLVGVRLGYLTRSNWHSMRAAWPAQPI